MTLKEKFKEVLTAFWINDWEDESIKLADELAIGFAEWLIDIDNKPKGEFTITELLEIYKKEKGL